MKKNLIAIAVAAAVSVPFAASAEDNITVYGLAQTEIGNTNYQASGVDSKTTVIDNANGRVGVAATEDLGGGLKGLAKMEFRIDTADGDAATACNTVNPGKDETTSGNPPTAGADGQTDAGTVGCSKSQGIAMTGRELFVGLAGGFGQVELGRLKSAYKYAGGVKYDPFVATLLEARNAGRGMSGGAFGQGGFLSRHIGYNSPKLGPVTFRVTYGPSTDDSSYTADVKFSFKMGEAFVAVADQGDRQKNVRDYSAAKIGGQLKFAGGAHKLSLQYEATEDKDLVANTSKKPTYVFVGYQGNFGKSTFVAQLGQFNSDVSGSNTPDATYFAIGAFYHFSKSTHVFGGYQNTNADNDSGQSTISIGLKKTFK